MYNSIFPLTWKATRLWPEGRAPSQHEELIKKSIREADSDPGPSNQPLFLGSERTDSACTGQPEKSLESLHLSSNHVMGMTSQMEGLGK